MEKKLRLLAVDDSRVIRVKIRQEFEASGFEVFEAEDGQDALDKMATVCPDVITMDIDMPVMNGYDATANIRKGNGSFAETHPHLKSVPIVFLTANDSDEERNKGFQAGATEFITKPFFKGELLAYVDLVLKPLKHFQDKTILVVDDSITVRMILRSALESKGINVIEAPDGPDAIEVLKNEDQVVDLVITSYLMPKMDGEILCQTIRNELGKKSLPVILLTGFCEKKILVKAFIAGANDYLIKPFISEELFARISPYLNVNSLQRDIRNMVQDIKRMHKSH